MKISKKTYFLILFSFRHRRIARTRRVAVATVAIIFVLVTFYLACERDFSPVGENKPPSNTPDTISQNFTWTIDTIGTDNSVLFDVVVINENNIWAVGEIHTPETDQFDSLGNWVPPYNAAHWDGQQWELKRINFYLCPNGTSPTPYPIQAVFAFSSDDIWFTRGGSIVHWNGTNFIHDCQINSVIDGSINKLWGTNSNNLYAVGHNGTVVRYDGSLSAGQAGSWQKLNSGTEIDLLDVWGSPDGSVVWACGYTDFVGTILLKITGTTVETVYEDNDNWFNIRQDSLSGVLTSLWTNDPSKLYVISPAGMYVASANTRGEAQRVWYNDDYLPGFPHRLRGQAENDIVTVGDFTMISHYNGKNWRYFEELSSRVSIQSVTITNDLVLAVGVHYTGISGLAIVITGRR